MTEVELLEDEVVQCNLNLGKYSRVIAYALARIIAAAREEGKEQERERIRKESLHYAEGEPLEGSDAESVEGEEAIAQQEMYVVPADVLAPTEVKP